MSEWLSYRPEDFLLFSEPVYWRLFERHNAALWPAPLAAVPASAFLLYAAWRPSLAGSRLAGMVLAGAWLSAGLLFLGQRYAAVNWAATYVVPFFVAQAVLVAALGWRGAFAAVRPGLPQMMGMALLVWAACLHPLLPLADGRPIAGAEPFGIAPDPTAMATLGLAVLSRSRWRSVLLPVPLLWCLASWLTLDTIGTWEAWVPLAAAAATLAAVAAALPQRRC